MLAYVYVGEVMVNAELVVQGHAKLMTTPPNVKHEALLVRQEREARVLQIGIWSAPSAFTGVASSAPVAAAPAPVPAWASAIAPAAAARPGVRPQDAWNCPSTHPIKGNFTPSSGERCIYHPPSGASYGRTKPERCYAADEDAVLDGCRRTKR